MVALVGWYIGMYESINFYTSMYVSIDIIIIVSLTIMNGENNFWSKNLHIHSAWNLDETKAQLIITTVFMVNIG